MSRRKQDEPPLSQKYHVRFDPEQMTHWKGYMQDALG